MNFVDFLVFLMSSGGLTAIIVGSHILSVPRDFLMKRSEKAEAFLSCPMCVGFWVGIFGSLTLPLAVNVFAAVASHFDNIDMGEE